MANQIVVSAGAKVRNLQDVIIGTSGVLTSLGFDVANGVPRLDVNGKILVSQLPNSVMEYKGTWSAATNTPTLVNGTGNQGDVYLCNVAGTVNFGAGPIAFVVGDQVIYSGSIWQRASGATGTVTSVAVTESGDSLNITGSPITTSGTINIGFNGTNLQYVNGAGNLTTFPILTGFVPYTGATTSVDLGLFSLTSNSIKVIGDNSTYGGTLSIKQSNVTSLIGVGYTELFGKTNRLGISFGAGSIALLSNSILTAERTYTFPDATGTIALTSDIPILTGYVPYTGATANVDLGTFNLTADVITGSTGSFASNGGSDTFAINHSSGAGIALNITKGGNGEGLYINKTSGSGNAATIIGTLNATTLVKSGGTSSQFLKADGTVDSSTYALDSAVVHNTGNETVGGTKTFSDATKNNGGIFLQNASSNALAGYMNLGGLTNGVKFTSGGGISNSFTLPSATGYTFTFPNATGTIALTSDISYPVTSVFGRTGAVVATSGDYTTDQVTEGTTNLYFTTLRARGAISATTPLVYSSVAGTMSIDKADTSLSGYLSATDWTTFNNKQATITLTTTGTSGAATFSSNTLNIPDYGGALSGYLPLTGGTLTGALSGTSASFSSTVIAGGTFRTTGGVFQLFNSSTFLGGLYPYATWLGSGSDYAPTLASTTDLYFATGDASSKKMILNSTGNLGLGVTPSAWALYKAIQVQGASIANFDTSDNSIIGSNVYYGGSPTDFRYISTGTSTMYRLNGGAHSWSTAISGSANAAITFTQAMTLDASGNLSIGVINPNTRLHIKGLNQTNGTVQFEPNAAKGIESSFIHYGATGDWYIRSASTSGKVIINDGGGNVLIGTTTDSGYKLDVNGTGRFSGSVYSEDVNSYLLNQTGNTTDTKIWSIQNLPTSGQFRIRALNDAMTNGINAIVISRTGISSLALDFTGAATFSSGIATLGYTASTSYAALFNGSVGIGTTAPATIFDAVGIITTRSASLNDIANPTEGIRFGWSSGGGDATYRNSIFNNISSSANQGLMQFRVNNGISSQAIVMSLLGSGNVLIGTTSDNGSKLQVQGGIRFNYSDNYGYFGLNYVSGADYGFYNYNYGRIDLKIAQSTGAATFSSTCTATGFFESSDSRLKTLIQDNYQTKGIASITPKLYTKNGKVELGYYAQDFVGILDSAISKGSDDMLSLSYREVHTAKIYALEQEIKELKAKLN